MGDRIGARQIVHHDHGPVFCDLETRWADKAGA